MKAHHPSDRWDKHGFIDDYACLWIQGILEYYRHTGDLGFRARNASDSANANWPGSKNNARREGSFAEGSSSSPAIQ